MCGRCIAAHKNKGSQSLFGIVQGGLQVELRKKCVEGKIFSCQNKNSAVTLIN